EAERALVETRDMLDALLAVEGERTVTNTLVPFDDLLLRVSEVSQQGDILFNVHPAEAMREAGDQVHQEAQRFLTALTLNRPLYEAFDAVDGEDEDKETQYALFKILRDFRQAGVDRDEATRANIQELRDEIVAIGQEFDGNIREDTRSIRLENAEELDGLPEDFIASHAPDEEGTIVVTTDYPDLFPVLQYAHREDVRRRLSWEHLNRGYPVNMEVLDNLLARRRELAEILDYDSFADYVTEDKMIGSAQSAEAFIDRITALAGSRSEEDHEALLEAKQRDSPEARRLEPWDRLYYTEKVRAAEHDFDSREVRAYFPFEKVLEGLLTITSRLFGVRYETVEDSPVWHESVRVYDVFEGETHLGRIYLDLHPRDAKYTHAASAGVVSGVLGIQLPQNLLMCNFPNPAEGEGPALMDHLQVVTFFHEFGHLIHSILSGQRRWAYNTMSHLEWDFIEAPSQLLEEWTWDTEALQTFARHHELGDPIPAELVERMRGADALGRGLAVRRQMFLAALSLNYYLRDPEGLDTTAVAKELQRKYDILPWYEGTHFQCNFGHLNGYSAIYYTYMWSLVIAKDLFTRFQAQGSLLDPAEGDRYRRLILAPGSARSAAELVETFLERPRNFDAYTDWISEVPGRAG
ncbi:MAG: Zn-dependent oligopeptidase, partial [Candidatus Thermoplasmatota archaeon]|nr:Zn-dependent oligopeptidase [Candidatus Thermoplasmatota archaeon]